jgi:predicted amidohydrolase
MIPTRAFENGIFILYANYAGEEGVLDFLGESIIVAPGGELLAQAGSDEAVITATLDPQHIVAARARLPYLANAAKARLSVK